MANLHIIIYRWSKPFNYHKLQKKNRENGQKKDEERFITNAMDMESTK